MSDKVRRLNSAGIASFAAYLQEIRNGNNPAPPFNLLTAAESSEEVEGDVLIELGQPSDTFGLGIYLQKTLSTLDRRKIAYDSGLWSWLSLYYFNHICPEENGKREVMEDAVYILAESFDHQRYYRHLLRTSWVAVTDNGEYAKVLLTTKGKRSEIFEQLASRQAIFGNPTVIEGAYRLYFDPVSGNTKRGSGGKGAGSPRRLVSFIRQIDLTYDLRDCNAEQFLTLLPKEFDKFRGQPSPSAPKKISLRSIFSRNRTRDTEAAVMPAAN